jgi:hypothetical protein
MTTWFSTTTKTATFHVETQVNLVSQSEGNKAVDTGEEAMQGFLYHNLTITPLPPKKKYSSIFLNMRRQRRLQNDVK